MRNPFRGSLMFPKPPTIKIQYSQEYLDWLKSIGLNLTWGDEVDANGIMFYSLWKEIQDLKK